jgi:amino acid adenylation domain-containing protein
MWFIDQLEPGAHYNDNFALILDGALDSTALERAVNAIVGRHQVLRTHFATHEGEPYQAIVGDLPIELVQVDLDKLQREARDAALQEEVRRRIRVPFDLAKGPLLRTVLFRLDAERHVLLLVIHQAVNDSWSLGRFCAELGALYSAFVDGVDDPLPPLEIQYGDYAEWQRQELDEEELADDLTYWKEHLAGELQVLELPLDHPRPAQQTFNGARQPVALSAGLRDRLTALAQANGCTLYMALLALFKVLLYRYSGQSDVIVGSPIANRNHRQLEPLLGMFVNTIALRTDLGGNPDIPALLRRVRQTATQGYAHAELPFERLVQALHPPADMSRTPIFQVLFDYHNTPMPTPAMQGLRADATAFDPGMSRFDLTLELADRNGMIAGWFEYNSDLFDAETIAALADHWQQLLEAAVAAPDTPIDRLPLLTADEERRLLIEWNATALELPADPAFHRLIERQAAATPEALAVVAGGQQLTYRELDERANRLAHHLQAKGVAPGVLVGICLERTIEMPVALLGVLKAGGGYLPLDPGYPAERIAFILNDANATLLLTQQSLLGRLPKSAAEPLCIDLEREAIDLCQSSTLEVTQQPDDLAYVIYTSGSTGKPKGVMVPHRAVLNFLGAMTKRPGLGADDILLAVTTLAFDIAVLELYLPLLVGGRVVIADREEAQDGRDLLALMREHGVTIMQATPATWRLLVESGWQGEPRLKVLCGGEALPKDLAADLIERVGGVWNMYGPTETTVWSTCAEITDAKQPIHVGKPIANTRLYVLDPQQQPVPVGAHGELYIGGTGVTLGYLGREKLTAERFVADPFTGAAEGLYRTGDLVRYNRAGELIYLNRLDNQVKVRGYRIELGEIETVLAACAGIARGVVVVREDRPGDRRLAAYYVLNDGAHTTPTELRKQLRIDLPDYMIPQHFVELDMLPLTPNGKVDRKALPSPFAGGAAEETLIEPETPAEQALAAIWQELLGDARIERHDNFFDVGGHSLLAVQVVVRAEKELGVELSLRSLVSDSLAQIAAGLKLSEALATSGETLPEMEMVAADPGDEPRARKGLFDRLKSKISGKEKG